MQKDYNLKDVTIAIGGTLAGGFADGEFLTFRPNSDRSSLTVGADGEAARSKLYDNSGEFEISLLQTSDTNDVLSGYSKSNSTFALAVMDMSGRTVLATVAAWVKKNPDVSYSKDITNRNWILQAGEVEIFIGGN